jgi:adenylate cyclase
LWALYERRHFRWRVIEAVQLVAGLSIPFLLAGHVVGQRVALEVFGVERGYAQALHLFWVASPASRHRAGRRAARRVVHGSIGIYFMAAVKTVLQASRTFC